MDESKSVDRAIQHLFRHLNNVSALKSNELVSGLFDSGVEEHILHAQIRMAVSGALDDVMAQHATAGGRGVHAARWRAIVERCDLGDESYVGVARDLGLETRQFYRERRAVREALSHTLSQRLLALRNVSAPLPRENDLLLDYAVGLAAFGQFNEAVLLLKRLVFEGRDLTVRLAAVTELAAVHAQLGNTAELARLHSVARDIYRLSPSQDVGLELELHMTQSLVARGADATSERMQALHHIISATSVPALGSNARSFDLVMRACLELVDLEITAGNGTNAEQILSFANRFSARGPAISYRTNLLTAQAQLDLYRGNLSRAKAAFGESLALARSLRIPRQIVAASQGLSIIDLCRENLEDADKHARNALVLAESLPSTTDVYTALVALAQIELERGDPAKALAYTSRASVELSYEYAEINDVAVAEVTMLLGAPGQALVLANDAIGKLERRGFYRFVGYAEMIRAQIFDRMQRGDEATRSIARAIDLLEACGTKYTLRHAYRISAAITGNSKHKQKSSEISSAFASAS